MVVPSKQQEFQEYVKNFNAKAGIIRELSVAIKQASNKVLSRMPNLSQYKSPLRESRGDDKLFLYVIATLSETDPKWRVFNDAIKLVKDALKSGGKWRWVPDLLDMLSRDGVACTRTAKGYELKHPLGPGRTAASAAEIDSAMQALDDVGFSVDNIRAFLNDLRAEAPQGVVSNKDLCRRVSKNYNGTMLTFSEMARALNGSYDFAVVKLEVQAVHAFFRRVATETPLRLLWEWNEEVVPSSGIGGRLGRTLGEVVTYLIENERSINNTVQSDGLKDLNEYAQKLAKTMSMAQLEDLISRSNYNIAADEFVKLGEQVVDTTQRKGDDRHARAMKELTDALEQLKNVRERLGGSLDVSDIASLIPDLGKRIASVWAAASRCMVASGSTSALSDRSPVAMWASTMGSSTSSFFSDVIQPFRAANVRGERRPDSARMEMYRDMMRMHVDRITKDGAVMEVQSARENARMIIGELVKTTTDPGCNRVQVRASILAAIKTYATNIDRILTKLHRRHSQFVMWSNRRALEYMVKWFSVRDVKRADGSSILSRENVECIQAYFNHLAAASHVVQRIMDDIEREGRVLFSDRMYMGIISEDEHVLETLQSRVDAFERRIVSVRMTLTRLYMPAGYSLFDVLTDPTFVIIYALKAFRVLLIWAALAIARGIFQPMYKDAVYVLNKAPPSAMYFALIFIAFDVALQLGVFVVLLALRYMFAGPDTAFPVTTHLLKAYLLDYVISTVLILALSLVVASVVSRKKYFRYRFEGDRGIRAMSDMLQLLSAAVLFVPYFRLLDT
jgi:hypothetical protein